MMPKSQMISSSQKNQDGVMTDNNNNSADNKDNNNSDDKKKMEECIRNAVVKEDEDTPRGDSTPCSHEEEPCATFHEKETTVENESGTEQKVDETTTEQRGVSSDEIDRHSKKDYSVISTRGEDRRLSAIHDNVDHDAPSAGKLLAVKDSSTAKNATECSDGNDTRTEQFLTTPSASDAAKEEDRATENVRDAHGATVEMMPFSVTSLVMKSDATPMAIAAPQGKLLETGDQDADIKNVIEKQKDQHSSANTVPIIDVKNLKADDTVNMSTDTPAQGDVENEEKRVSTDTFLVAGSMPRETNNTAIEDLTREGTSCAASMQGGPSGEAKKVVEVATNIAPGTSDSIVDEEEKPVAAILDAEKFKTAPETKEDQRQQFSRLPPMESVNEEATAVAVNSSAICSQKGHSIVERAAIKPTQSTNEHDLTVAEKVEEKDTMTDPFTGVERSATEASVDRLTTGDGDKDRDSMDTATSDASTNALVFSFKDGAADDCTDTNDNNGLKNNVHSITTASSMIDRIPAIGREKLAGSEDLIPISADNDAKIALDKKVSTSATLLDSRNEDTPDVVDAGTAKDNKSSANIKENTKTRNRSTELSTSKRKDDALSARSGLDEKASMRVFPNTIGLQDNTSTSTNRELNACIEEQDYSGLSDNAEYNTDSLQCFFPGIRTFKKKRQVRKRAGQLSKKRINISLRVKRLESVESTQFVSSQGDLSLASPRPMKFNVKECLGDLSQTDYQSAHESCSLFDVEGVDRLELEHQDPLEFFSGTHEEQDSSFIELARSREKKRFEKELKKYVEEEKNAKDLLDKLLEEKWQEQVSAFQKQMKKLRAEREEKQAYQKKQLLARQKKQIESDKSKIAQGLNLLTTRQKTEMQNALLQSQQKAQKIGQEHAAAEWARLSQQLQLKHQHELRQLQAKETEIKKRCEIGYKQGCATLRKHHQRRQAEMDQAVEQLHNRFRNRQQQSRHFHLKCHDERMKLKRERITAKFSDIQRSILATEGWDSLTLAGRTASVNVKNDDNDDEDDDTLPPPIKSPCVKIPSGSSTNTGGGVGQELPHIWSGIVLRQRRRKTVSSGLIPTMWVEIHNEGIVVGGLSDTNYQPDGDSKSNSEKGKSIDDKLSHGKKSLSVSLAHTSAGDSSSTLYGKANVFIPWGAKARKILYSTLCGEIPFGYCDDITSIGPQGALQAGQIKCVITDMRTNDKTASSQLSLVAKEMEESKSPVNVSELEQKERTLKVVATEAEKESASSLSEENKCVKDLKVAMNDAENARRTEQDLKSQASRCFGEDSIPQNLLQALMHSKTNVESCEKREEAAKKAFDDARVLSTTLRNKLKAAQKAAHAAEMAQKRATKKDQADRAKKICTRSVQTKDSVNVESEEIKTAPSRVGGILALLEATFEKRRSELNTKRSHTANKSWEDALPSVSDALKKSLWNKMQRRRLTITLRPTRASILSEIHGTLQEELAKRSDSPQTQKRQNDVTDSDELTPALRAEQLLLLALHPEAHKVPLPSIPLSSSSEQWAEPGWKVVLDVGKDFSDSRTLLPRTANVCFLDSMTTEYYSSSGHQAASLLKPWHLRSLMAPLSTLSQWSAPAEPNSDEIMGFDPMHVSDEIISAGYNFVLKSDHDSKSQLSTLAVTKRSSVSSGKDESDNSSAAKRQRSSKGDSDSVATAERVPPHSLDKKPTNRIAPEKATKTKAQASVKLNSSNQPRSSYQTKQTAATAQNIHDSTTAQSQSKSSLCPSQAISPIPPAPAVGGMYRQPTVANSLQAEQYRRFMTQREAIQMQQVAQLQSQSPSVQNSQNIQSPQTQRSLQQLQQPRIMLPQVPVTQQPQQQYQQQQFQQHRQQQYQNQQQQIARMRFMQQQQQAQVTPQQYMTQQPVPMQNHQPHMQAMSYMGQSPYQPQQLAPPQSTVPYQGPPLQMPGSSGMVGQSMPGGGSGVPLQLSRPSTAPAAAAVNPNRGNDNGLNDPLLMLFDDDF